MTCGRRGPGQAHGAPKLRLLRSRWIRRERQDQSKHQAETMGECHGPRARFE